MRNNMTQAEREAQAMSCLRSAGRDGLTKRRLADECGLSSHRISEITRKLRNAKLCVQRGRCVSARWYAAGMAPQTTEQDTESDAEQDADKDPNPILQRIVRAADAQPLRVTAPASVFHLAG